MVLSLVHFISGPSTSHTAVFGFPFGQSIAPDPVDSAAGARYSHREIRLDMRAAAAAAAEAAAAAAAAAEAIPAYCGSELAAAAAAAACDFRKEVNAAFWGCWQD